MGSIIERKRKDGTVAYMAQIMIMRDRKIVFRENRTFERRPAANAWLKKREAELAQPGALASVKAAKRTATLADAIDKYVRESIRPIGKTKAKSWRQSKASISRTYPALRSGANRLLPSRRSLEKHEPHPQSQTISRTYRPCSVSPGRRGATSSTMMPCVMPSSLQGPRSNRAFQG